MRVDMIRGSRDTTTRGSIGATLGFGNHPYGIMRAKLWRWISRTLRTETTNMREKHARELASAQTQGRRPRAPGPSSKPGGWTRNVYPQWCAGHPGFAE